MKVNVASKKDYGSDGVSNPYVNKYQQLDEAATDDKSGFISDIKLPNDSDANINFSSGNFDIDKEKYLEKGSEHGSSSSSSAYEHEQEEHEASISRTFSMSTVAGDNPSEKEPRNLFKMPIILPHYQSKIKWDKFVLFLIVFSMVQLPLQNGFESLHTPVTESMSIATLVAFWFDLYFNFKTAYIHKNLYVIDPALIAKNYLLTWFLPDLLASIPISEAFTYIWPELEDLGDILRWLRLLRLGRLLRILSVASLRKMSQLKAFLLLTMTLLIFSHFIACFFHQLVEFDQDSWVRANHLEYASTLTRYINALYYAITVVTTVGFGDIHATNGLERVFAIISTFIGANLYALILALISLIIHQLFQKGEKQRSVDAACSEYAKSLHLGYEFETKLLACTRTLVEETEKYSMEYLMNLNLPASMKTEIMCKAFKPIVIPPASKLTSTEKESRAREITTPFIYCDDETLLYIAKNLKLLYCPQGETILNGNSFDDDKIYITVHGSIRLYDLNECEITRLRHGCYFGDINFFYPKSKYGINNDMASVPAAISPQVRNEDSNGRRKSASKKIKRVGYVTAKPVSNASCFTLSFQVFGKLEQFNPVIFELFRKIAEARASQVGAYRDKSLVHKICSKMNGQCQDLMQYQFGDYSNTSINVHGMASHE